MVLVHIEPESDLDVSLGPPMMMGQERRKKVSLTGSDGDLPSLVLNDEFDLAMRKLREPLPENLMSMNWSMSPESDLTSLFSRDRRYNKYQMNGRFGESPSVGFINLSTISHVEEQSTKENESLNFSNDFTETSNTEVETPTNDANVDWFGDLMAVNATTSATTNSSSIFPTSGKLNAHFATPITPSPQSRGEYSGDDLDDYSSTNGDDLFSRGGNYRNKMSTPDDERSTDSGFKDKESCEEESPLAGHQTSTFSASNTPTTTKASTTLFDVREEEQLQVLYELDNILDAACQDLPEPDDRRDQVEQLKREISSLRDHQQLHHHQEIPDMSKDAQDDDSSTISLRSENSYVSFDIDEEFVQAIRNELKEKLPHAQMSVTEPQEPLELDSISLNSDVDPVVNNWDGGDPDDEDDEELNDLAERTDSIDVSIRYNATFGMALSPIMEEKESFSLSDSTISRELFGNADDFSSSPTSTSLSMTTKPKEGDEGEEEDVMFVNTRTNEAMFISSPAEEDFSKLNFNFEDGSLMAESGENDNRLQGLKSGAPLPSPEEEKSQLSYECSLPPTLTGSGNLNSEDEKEDDDDSNSTSSGEYVWKAYATSHIGGRENEDMKKMNSSKAANKDEDEDEEEADDDEDDEEQVEEFTPSAWDASLAPHKSSIRSPEKSSKSRERKKNVQFKKQRYHCVYEYPKETPPSDQPSPLLPSWTPTSYADWEGMNDHIDRLNFSHLDQFETKNASDEEFCVSSSNRPFQFCPSDEKFVSQFFPGDDEVVNPVPEFAEAPKVEEDKKHLGELRHCRDKLKLNLLPTNGIGNCGSGMFSGNHASARELLRRASQEDVEDEEEASDECNNLTTIAHKSPVEEAPHVSNNVNSND